MFITWQGLACVKMQERDTLLIADPYGKNTGLRTSTADIVTASTKTVADDIQHLKDGCLFIDGPGEFEKQGITIDGIEIAGVKKSEPVTVFIYKMSGVTLCHLGTLGRELTDEELDRLGSIDILLLPVGGGRFMDSDLAQKIANQIEPRIIIPIAYKSGKSSEKLDGVEGFLKAFGVGKKTPEAKIKLTKKDLPQEETTVMLLEPQGY